MSVYPLIKEPAYSEIDHALSQWALKRGVLWVTEYQDYEVRTVYIGEGPGRAIVSVDAPQNQQTIVRLGQNRRGLSRLSRRADLPTSVVGLPDTLDRALQVARDWLAEDEVS